MKNYYHILQVKRSATAEEITKAFRELAFEYHPDVCKYPNAHNLFININEAYQVLGDAEKKARYDLLYDRYIHRQKIDITNEHGIRRDVRKWARKGKERAKKDAKTRFYEYIQNLSCYFNNYEKADGPPYYFYLHKTTGIKGGVFPMGSIKSNVVTIPIPRSKKSIRCHHIGFFIKLFFLICAIMVFFVYPFNMREPTHQIVLSSSLILLGTAITYAFYHFKHTKPIFFYARRYFLVKKYLKRGYSVGFHPIITTTPFGIIYHLFKWLL